MGKNLKGKECGKGIYQRKDGTYHARFKDRNVHVTDESMNNAVQQFEACQSAIPAQIA